MMRGLPGTGKSTFSKAIAGSLDAVVIENDVIRNQIKILFNKKSVCKKIFDFNKTASKIAYLTSYEVLSQNIKVNHSVIFDSCGMNMDKYNNCKKLAKNKCKLIVCECYCSNLDILSERLKKRNHSWKMSSLDEVLEYSEKKDELCAKYQIKIDTCKSIKSNVKKFLTYVKDIEKIY